MPAEVFVTRIARFLPNEPVGNEEMEEYLGLLNGKKSRSRRIVLRSNGIERRYYALDKQGRPTHSNAQLTLEAIRGLCGNGFELADIELLASGTTTPDQLLPGHAVMVHGLMGARPVQAISFSGSCCSGMNALNYGYLSVLAGSARNAVVTGSERLSTWMTAKNFSEETRSLAELEGNPVLAFEKDFLRWMLSDGAAAVLLRDRPAGDGLSLKLEWIDLVSYANEVETCMYAGAEKLEDGSLRGWAEQTPAEWASRSIFSLKQDVKLLNETIARLGARAYLEVLDKRHLRPEEIDFFLPHLSSEFFHSRIDEEMKKVGKAIPSDRWFINLTRVGNVGSASIFLALEELFHSGRLQKGQRILLAVPESARFSYGYALLTVV